jgi:hypothetical protein
MSKVDEVARKAKYHAVLESLSYIDRFLVRTLIRLVVIIHNRVGDRFSVGCVFFERDADAIANEKRSNIRILKDEQQETE